MRISLTLALIFAACADGGGGKDATDGYWRDTGWGGNSSSDTGSDIAEPDVPAEQEDDHLALRPAETDVFVFIANPDNDSVTRVNAASLEVRTSPVGHTPSAVAVTADWKTAVVFNQGDATVSIVDAATLDTVAVAVRPNLNQMKLSPDGRWAMLWHDVAAEKAGEVATGGATSYNEVSLVDLVGKVHHGLVVGFNPKSVRFTPDGRLALAVSDASLATVDLSGDAPVATYVPIADPLEPPVAEEVEVSPNGAFAFIRQRAIDQLTVVDLATRVVSAIPVPAGPTDLDLSANGTELLLVSRTAASVSRFQVADPFATAAVTAIPGATALGSILLAPNGDAVLYTTAVPLGRYATWNLGSDEITLHPLNKPAQSMALTDDGASLLVIHGTANNDDGSTPEAYRGKSGLSLISLADQRTNTLALSAAISGYAVNGAHGYAILDGRSVLEVLDYRTLLHDEIALRSPAVFVGALPQLVPGGPEPKAWVSQQHPLGRITFYDPASVATTTITGFELNGQIED
jgi:DNA-binding beta-propeller fold protein YncE